MSRTENENVASKWIARGLGIVLAASGCDGDEPGRTDTRGQGEEQADDADPRSILASEAATERTGVVRYEVFTEGNSQRVIGFGADGRPLGTSEADYQADGTLTVTYIFGGDAVTLQHDPPEVDEDGRDVIRLTIDDERVTVRDTPDGPVVEGELHLEHPEVLEAWGVLDQDLAEFVGQWRTWSCSACLVLSTACIAGTSLCIATCASGINVIGCYQCFVSVTTCWTSFSQNCEGACASEESGGGVG